MTSRFRQRFFRNKAGLFGLAVVILILLLALLAPWLAPKDPSQQFFDGLTLEGKPLPPGGQFLLGTDTLGRDLLSRLIWGARASMLVGLIANGAAVLIGALVGASAGYFRG
ncbi:MAG: ABC transporter permease, partial [Thermaceae bacterium]|nr:ABC transporter permease [Thermaceae bacterium]